MAVINNKQAFFTLKCKQEVVPVPELGGEVILSELSAAAAEAFFAKVNSARGKLSSSQTQAWMLIYSIVDETGTRVFDEKDINKLVNLPLPVLAKLFEKAALLNNLGTEAEDILKNG